MLGAVLVIKMSKSGNMDGIWWVFRYGNFTITRAKIWFPPLQKNS